MLTTKTRNTDKFFEDLDISRMRGNTSSVAMVPDRPAIVYTGPTDLNEVGWKRMKKQFIFLLHSRLKIWIKFFWAYWVKI